MITSDQHARLPYRRNVGVMLANRDGKVFVGQRSDRDTDAWQMPQGGLDKGETAQQAALRELEEETGVPAALVEVVAESQSWLSYDLPDAVIPTIWGGRYRGQEQKWFLLRYLGTDEQVNIATDHAEFSAWKWVAPKDLVAGIVPFKREVYTRVLEEFGDKL